jgi:membrane-bound lytic murein transglycosylase F
MQRVLRHQKNWAPWGKVAIAASAVTLLSSYTPVPSVIDQIKILGELRVVTRNGPLAYFQGADGRPEGPEYELARRFADELGVRLKLMPMRSYAAIYEAITTGRAHIAAAGIKVPPAPVRGVVFGPAYQHVREHLVYRRGSNRPGSLAEVRNGDLEIPAGSSHTQALHEERNFIPELVWIENASTDSQALLDGVARGSIDYTIADSTEFALAHTMHPDLRIAFDFAHDESLAWGVSAHDPQFQRAIADYFARAKADGALASIVNRYYSRSPDMDFVGPHGFMRDIRGRLQLYREWFEEAAAETGSDWRLLAAIAYQESKWNPAAISPAGARGLMQLTEPSAGAERVANPADPRESIFGGARYFKQVLDRIPNHVREPDRTWFALAAYNIGYGHVEDARVLTQRAGRNPDSWHDVREFLPLLSQDSYYTQADNGYARGWEPVHYVDNVRGYRDLLEWVWNGSERTLN